MAYLCEQHHVVLNLSRWEISLNTAYIETFFLLALYVSAWMELLQLVYWWTMLLLSWYYYLLYLLVEYPILQIMLFEGVLQLSCVDIFHPLLFVVLSLFVLTRHSSLLRLGKTQQSHEFSDVSCNWNRSCRFSRTPSCHTQRTLCHYDLDEFSHAFLNDLYDERIVHIGIGAYIAGTLLS